MKTLFVILTLFPFLISGQSVNIGKRITAPGATNYLDTLYVFDEGNASFTGGFLGFTPAWSPDDVGFGSFSYGAGPQASGFYSLAIGVQAKSEGLYSIALGNNVNALSESSVAIGSYAIAEGENTFATGQSSRAIGTGSVAIGQSARAEGMNALALGHGNTAAGLASTALGYNSDAEGDFSVAMGQGLLVPSFSEIAIGSFNTIVTPQSNNNWIAEDRLFVIGNGSGLGNTPERSDAMVLKKNGDVSFPDGDFIVGRDALPLNGEMVNDTFFFFDKSKGAFRGGSLFNSSNWAPDSIGIGSFAYGWSVRAKGPFSVALGIGSIASGPFSFASGSTAAQGSHSFATGLGSLASGYGSLATGNYSWASGRYSFAAGQLTIASGENSFATGRGSLASGDNSFSSGFNSTASGLYSFSSGSISTASGRHSFAAGRLTEASGIGGFSSGILTKASGDNSFASGVRTTARSYAEFTLGAFNTDYIPVDSISWNTNDRLFVIGNGSSWSAKSDALVMLKNGNTSINGNLNLKGESTIEAVNSSSDAILYTKSGTSPQTRVILHQKGTEDIFIGDLDGLGGNLRLRANGADRLVITPAGNIAVKDGDLMTNTSTNDLGRDGSSWNKLWLKNGVDDSSDRRLKKNIVNLNYGLSSILALRPVSYEWKENNVGTKLGLIAQELKEVIPEIVHVPDNPEEFMSVTYSELIPVLIKSIQEQQEIIKDQGDRIIALEEKIEMLSKKANN